MTPQPVILHCSCHVSLWCFRPSGLVDELYDDDGDDETIVTEPVYLGGPIVSDDILPDDRTRLAASFLTRDNSCIKLIQGCAAVEI